MDSVETVEMERPNFTELTNVDKFWLEFEQKMYEYSTKVEYPTINIRKRPWAHSITNRLIGYHFNIMCACPGFSTQELKVIVQNNILYISGKKAAYKREEVKEYKYIVRKVKDKDFDFILPLTEKTKIHHVGVSNGILHITLAIGNPEFETPKEFEIV